MLDIYKYLLPDGWRWREEDEKEEAAHEDDEHWFGRSHREKFLGDDPKKELWHRFDDTKVCNLLVQKDSISEAIGKRIAEKLPNYKDGALQLILKKLTYPDLENALYVLPEEAENRIASNLSTQCIPIIKGDCILNKDSVNSIDIRLAVKRLEEAIDAYDGDFALEAGYEH